MEHLPNRIALDTSTSLGFTKLTVEPQSISISVGALLRSSFTADSHHRRSSGEARFTVGDVMELATPVGVKITTRSSFKPMITQGAIGMERGRWQTW